MYWLKVSCLLVTCIITIRADDTWKTHVYTGRHLDNLILDSRKMVGQLDESIVMTPTVLVLYDSSCKDKVSDIASHFPPVNYVTLAMYNHKMSEERIWYTLDEEDDLRDRFGAHSCPDAIYLPKGGTVDRPVPWIQSESIVQWVWGLNMFQKKIEIKNDLLDVIEVHVVGRGPALEPVKINPGVYTTVKALVSYSVMIKKENSDKLLMYFIVENNANGMDITVNDGSVKKYVTVDQTEWLNQVDKEISSIEKETLDKREKIASMYAVGIKQPLLLPKFSEIGINETLEFDAEIITTIQKFKSEHENSFVYVNLEPTLNTDDVKVKYVKFDIQLQEYLVSKIQPVLELWTGVKLKLGEVEGLYTVSEGAMIRQHNGKADFNVISAMVMVDTDNDDWELDFIGFNGERKSIDFKPGSILAYEAATVIHGSQTSFQGKSASFVYLHFRPADHWSWSMVDGAITDGSMKEDIYELNTPLTVRDTRNKQLNKKWHVHLHDEL